MDKTKSLGLRIGAFVRFGANTKLTQKVAAIPEQGCSAADAQLVREQLYGAGDGS